MSSVNSHAHPPGEIIEYLNNHPDFFVKHPELLAELTIPHGTGGNIASLIEYQVVRLRRDLDEVRNRLTRTEYDAAYHRKLIGNIHALSLELLMARTPQDLYNILRRELKILYAADKVLLLIFTRLKTMSNYSGLKFHGTNTALRFMYTELFHLGKPLCGSLQEEHTMSLFGENGDMIKSTVLIPFAGGGWQSLLVLGSHTENRYGHGLELDLLKYINDIVCRAISSRVSG